MLKVNEGSMLTMHHHKVPFNDFEEEISYLKRKARDLQQEVEELENQNKKIKGSELLLLQEENKYLKSEVYIHRNTMKFVREFVSSASELYRELLHTDLIAANTMFSNFLANTVLKNTRRKRRQLLENIEEMPGRERVQMIETFLANSVELEAAVCEEPFAPSVLISRGADRVGSMRERWVRMDIEDIPTEAGKLSGFFEIVCQMGGYKQLFTFFLSQTHSKVEVIHYPINKHLHKVDINRDGIKEKFFFFMQATESEGVFTRSHSFLPREDIKIEQLEAKSAHFSEVFHMMPGKDKNHCNMSYIFRWNRSLLPTIIRENTTLPSIENSKVDFFGRALIGNPEDHIFSTILKVVYAATRVNLK